ncbi:MAG: hypothetical protein OXI53_06750 [Nitrospira sp.]|nr:hypothetical protein [Nitrospira sp.]
MAADSTETGCIYLVRLAEKRFKVGFAKGSSADQRLQAGRSWVPDLKKLGEWPALKMWEGIAFEVLSMGGNRLSEGAGGEVFEFDRVSNDIEEHLVAVGNTLFARLGQPEKSNTKNSSQAIMALLAEFVHEKTPSPKPLRVVDGTKS